MMLNRESKLLSATVYVHVYEYRRTGVNMCRDAQPLQVPHANQAAVGA